MKLRKLLVLLLLLGAAFVLSACAQDGEKGATGPKGATGDTGIAGTNGTNGTDGADGENGTNGTDGVGIEFSTTSDGIVWRYVGTTEWTVGVEYTDIFKAISDYQIGPKVREYGFDYYVGKFAVNQTAGADLTVFGKELKVGETAFTTLTEAFAQAKVDAAKEGYEGLKIFLDAGTYTDYAVVEANNVTVFGPNVGINPNTALRNTEATINGGIFVRANDFTINGVEFGGVAESVDADGVVTEGGAATDLGRCNMNVLGNNVKILYCASAEENTKAYMLDFQTVDGLEIGYSEIDTTHSGSGLRPVRGVTGTQSNINIHDSVIRNHAAAGSLCDSIRFNNISGTLLIEDNTIDWSSNNWGVFLGSSSNTCSKIEFINNIMDCTDNDAYGSGLSIRNLATVTKDCEVNILYNEFGNISGTNIQLRLTGTALVAESTLKINIKYMIYTNANTYFNVDAALVSYLTVSDCYFQATYTEHISPATVVVTNVIANVADVPTKPEE